MTLWLQKSKSFQSTPSVWRETFKRFLHVFGFEISIHSLRVEGDCTFHAEFCHAQISIHSLRVEGDMQRMVQAMATVISIHSLRVEGDAVSGSHHMARA